MPKIVNIAYLTSKMSALRVLLEKLFDLIDTDGNLEINWNEFLTFQAKAKSILNADWPFDIRLIRQEFTEMDSDGSGTISKTEFLNVFSNNFNSTKLSEFEKMLEKLNNVEKTEFVKQKMAEFDKFDLDGNGSIDFGEFVRKNWGESGNEKSKQTLRQLRRKFKQHDTNNDGKISREEYQTMLEKYYQM